LAILIQDPGRFPLGWESEEPSFLFTVFILSSLKGLL
jgi:hypothetical protein